MTHRAGTTSSSPCTTSSPFSRFMDTVRCSTCNHVCRCDHVGPPWYRPVLRMVCLTVPERLYDMVRHGRCASGWVSSAGDGQPGREHRNQAAMMACTKSGARAVPRMTAQGAVQGATQEQTVQGVCLVRHQRQMHRQAHKYGWQASHAVVRRKKTQQTAFRCCGSCYCANKSTDSKETKMPSSKTHTCVTGSNASKSAPHSTMSFASASASRPAPPMGTSHTSAPPSPTSRVPSNRSPESTASERRRTSQLSASIGLMRDGAFGGAALPALKEYRMCRMKLI